MIEQTAAIVTGAAAGLGLAIAQRLAADGHPVLLVDRDEGELGAAARVVERAGMPVATLVADVTDAEAPAVVVAAAADAYGDASVLINNAGIVPYAPFLDTAPAMLEEVLRIDVASVFLVSQAFARYRVERGGGGCIVNLGTGHALVGVAGTAAYAAAKGAVHALTRALAVELAPHGIRVNTLALGTTMTERVRRTLPAETLATRLRQIPLGRGAEPGEAAEAAAYLVGAGYTTGTELVVDGGFSIFGDG